MAKTLIDTVKEKHSFSYVIDRWDTVLGCVTVRFYLPDTTPLSVFGKFIAIDFTREASRDKITGQIQYSYNIDRNTGVKIIIDDIIHLRKLIGSTLFNCNIETSDDKILSFKQIDQCIKYYGKVIESEFLWKP